MSDWQINSALLAAHNIAKALGAISFAMVFISFVRGVWAIIKAFPPPEIR